MTTIDYSVQIESQWCQHVEFSNSFSFQKNSNTHLHHSVFGSLILSYYLWQPYAEGYFTTSMARQERQKLYPNWKIIMILAKDYLLNVKHTSTKKNHIKPHEGQLFLPLTRKLKQWNDVFPFLNLLWVSLYYFFCRDFREFFSF